MICPACELANAAGATRCAHCGRELQDNAPVTMPPVARAVNTTRVAAAAPGLALSDSDPAAGTIANSSSDGQASSADSDATLISPSPFSPAPLSAPMSAIPVAGAGTTMATGPSNSPGTGGSRLPNFGPRYEVLDVLGQGGMGAVYKARDLELDRLVALKLLRPELVPDAASIQRFKQELLLASKISHRNILRIHDLGDWNGVKFISMAYIEGHDLHRLIREQKRLPVERALSFARQILHALDAAHAEGVVHRDLKPQNIMIGGGDHLYVMDFGLAKSAESDLHMTLTGQVVGTPQYMAPEQVEGGAIDHRADLYAFGLILDEMLTGELVFRGDSAFQLMLKRLREDARDPRTVVPDLPPYLAEIEMRCLQRDPAARYQSAREILDDLHAHQATVNTVVTPSALAAAAAAPLQTPVRKKKTLIAAAIVAAVLAIAVPVGVYIGRSPSHTVGGGGGVDYVAVLPFRVIGDDTAKADFGYVADGVAEALSAKLFDVSNVHVASGTDLKNVGPDDKDTDIGHKVGVNYLIRGSIQGSNDHVGITAYLIDAKTGERKASAVIDGNRQDLLTLEDNLYTKLASAMNPKLSSTELARGNANPTENNEAYDLYLKGRDAMHGKPDVQHLQSAVDFYNQALKKDANFALAYTGLVDASLRMYQETSEPIWSQRAEADGTRAKELGANLPEVHFSLGSLYSATGKTAEAISELQSAIKIKPDSDEAYRRLGDAYLAGGNKKDALPAYKAAIAKGPYFWLNHNALGVAYLRSGDMKNAADEFQKVTQMAPGEAIGYRNLGAAYYSLGRLDDSVQEYEKSLQYDPNDQKTISNLGTTYFLEKRYPDAVKMYEKAVKLRPNYELGFGNLGDAYRWSGRTADANAAYDKAIQLGFTQLQVNPKDALTMGRVATYYAKKGDLAQAIEYIQRARQIDPTKVDPVYDSAEINAIAGKKDEALRDLRDALIKGYSAKDAASDPELGKLQQDPQFKALIEQFSKVA